MNMALHWSSFRELACRVVSDGRAEMDQHECGPGYLGDLPGLAVMCYRVRQRWPGRANARSPMHRTDRRSALLMLVPRSRSLPPGDCFTGVCIPIPVPS
jgi:hypothetical protein